MEFNENQLLRLVDEEGVIRLLRIIQFDDCRKTMCLFDVEVQNALPEMWNLDQLLDVERDGRLSNLASDPWQPRWIPNIDDLPDLEQKRWEPSLKVRDKLAKIIDAITFLPFENLSDHRALRKLARDTGKLENCSRTTVESAWRKYWRGGQTINCLLPNFDGRGGKGIPRIAVDGSKKRGRKPAFIAEHPEWIGINITEAIKNKLRRGYRLFYLNRVLRLSLREAFGRTLSTFFVTDVEKRPDGTLVPILLEPHLVPTIAQFKYWGEKFKRANLQKSLIKRYGQKIVDLNFRHMQGGSSRMAKGPNWIAQLDAWEPDIYLRSIHNRALNVGKPFAVFVRCMFSHLIIGVYVGFERGYLSNALALENTASEKTSYCSQFGIKDAYWPAHHLPRYVLADWGELGGKQPNHWVQALDVRLAHTPRARPNMKGLIEVTHAQLYERAVRYLDGGIRRDLGSEERDARLDGLFTLDEFTEIVLRSILLINSSQQIDPTTYDVLEGMIVDDVNLYPLDLWEWGCANRGSGLRTVTPDVLRLHLLPGKRAQVTQSGLMVDGILYNCDRAHREGWFVNEQVRRSQKGTKRGVTWIDVAYDPRNISVMYLRFEGKNDLEICTLVRPQAWAGRPWREYDSWLKARKLNRRNSEGINRQAEAEFRAVVARTTEIARFQADIDQAGKTNSSIMKIDVESRDSERATRGVIDSLKIPNPISSANSLPVGNSVQATDSLEDPPNYSTKLLEYKLKKLTRKDLN
jgi:putative transposase